MLQSLQVNIVIGYKQLRDKLQLHYWNDQKKKAEIHVSIYIL